MDFNFYGWKLRWLLFAGIPTATIISFQSNPDWFPWLFLAIATRWTDILTTILCLRIGATETASGLGRNPKTENLFGLAVLQSIILAWTIPINSFSSLITPNPMAWIYIVITCMSLGISISNFATYILTPLVERQSSEEDKIRMANRFESFTTRLSPVTAGLLLLLLSIR